MTTYYEEYTARAKKPGPVYCYKLDGAGKLHLMGIIPARPDPRGVDAKMTLDALLRLLCNMDAEERKAFVAEYRRRKQQKDDRQQKVDNNPGPA